MKKNIACVVSSSNAKIYLGELKSKEHPKLECINVIDNHDARLKESDLVSSANGRIHHGSAEPQHSAKEVELGRYIKLLVGTLHECYEQHEKAGLIIVANPKLLGMIRKELSSELEKHVVLEVEKDYVSVPPDELSGKVRDLLYPILKPD